MTETGLSILKYKDKTPVLASCDRCRLKFLTPVGMMSDPVAASDYLWKKYHDHHCTAIARRRHAVDDSFLSFESGTTH